MDIQTLTLLLTSPYTFGALISWVLEQLSFFKDERQSPALKIAVVIAICQLWAVFAFILNDTGQSLTIAVVRTVIYNGLAVAVGSQVFHALVNKILPGLMDFALSLLSLRSTTTVATSNTVSTGYGSISKTEVTSGATDTGKTLLDTTIADEKLYSPVPLTGWQSSPGDAKLNG